MSVAVAVWLAGMGVGAFNEVVEFFTTLVLEDTNVGGYQNTGRDLVANHARGGRGSADRRAPTARVAALGMVNSERGNTRRYEALAARDRNASPRRCCRGDCGDVVRGDSAGSARSAAGRRATPA